MTDQRSPTLTQRMEAVEEHVLRLRHDKTKIEWISKHPWKALGMAVPIVALAVSYFAWWQPQWKQREERDLAQQVDNQIEGKLKDHHFGDMATDIATMKGQMTEISGFVKVIAEKQMKQISSLPSREFQDNLHEVKTVLAVAKISHADVSPATVGAIQSKLIQADHASDDFRGAASAMINYRSPDESRHLPRCLDNPPFMRLTKAIQAGPPPRDIYVTPPRYEDCVIDLSDSVPEKVVEFWKGAGEDRLEFYRCKVIYRGGAVPLLSLVPKLVFTASVFEITTPTPPPSHGRELVVNLLSAKDMAAVNFDSSGG